MERISVDASGVLTHALMMREKEGQDKEVYNGMIQVRSPVGSLLSECCAAAAAAGVGRLAKDAFSTHRTLSLRRPR